MTSDPIDQHIVTTSTDTIDAQLVVGVKESLLWSSGAFPARQFPGQL